MNRHDKLGLFGNLIVLLTIGAILTSCAQPISLTQSRPLGEQTKVSAVRVTFNTKFPTRIRVTSNTVPSSYKEDAEKALQAYRNAFSADFFTRFPMLAAQRGLAVTPTADYELEFHFLEQLTSCLPRCNTFLIVAASLLNPQKVPVWSFQTRVWQLKAEDGVNTTTFDNLANEALRSMQADGFLK